MNNTTKVKTDKYDDAVELLTKNPRLISEAWNHPSDSLGGALFQYSGKSCGCLTQVRGGDVAATTDLTDAIRADERIPLRPEDITAEHLPVFAEWQRRLDKELNRTR